MKNLSPKQQVKHLRVQHPKNDDLEINSQERLLVTSLSLYPCPCSFIFTNKALDSSPHRAYLPVAKEKALLSSQGHGAAYVFFTLKADAILS